MNTVTKKSNITPVNSIKDLEFDAVSFEVKHVSDFTSSTALPIEIDTCTELFIEIDPEFQSLIPPLSSEERSLLEESILLEGCRDALVVWLQVETLPDRSQQRKQILIDGHNRYSICRQHNVSFSIVEMNFSEKEEAIAWTIRNQLSRRNLTPEAISYFRGKLYNSLKAKVTNPSGKNQYQLDGTTALGAKTQEVSGHFDHQPKTEEILAAEYKVGSRTIRRDADYAAEVDALAFVVGNEIRPQLLSRRAKLSKKQTKELARIAQETPEILKEAIAEGGEILDVVERIKRKVDERANISFPFHVGEVCLIQPQGNKDLRQYKGCWAIVKTIYNFSCKVTVWDSEIQVQEKNLKSLEYTAEGEEQRSALAQRLHAIAEAGGLDEPVIRTSLEFFGSLQRSYLTEIEEGLLNWIERATVRD